MKLKEFKLGPMPTNAQLVYTEGKAILFDCGGENLDVVVNFLKEENLELTKVVFTHGHFDHIGGLTKLKSLFPEIEIYIGEEEEEFLYNSDLSLSRMLSGTDYKYEGKVITVKEGDKIDGFTVIDTPGHTRGGKSFYSEELETLIAGDTMFKGSYGRYDLPTSNGEVLFQTLKKLCNELPKETKVYNGHTPFTTIGEESMNLKGRGLI